MKVLNITDEFGIDDGVSVHVTDLSEGLKKYNCENMILMGKIRNSVNNGEIFESHLLYHSNRSTTNFLKAIKFLADFVTANKIDIINSHSHYSANIAKYASFLSKVKTIQTNHGLLSKPGLLKEFNADKIILTNEHSYARYNKNNAVLIKHGLKYLPFDETKFIRPVKIFSSSRFVKEKNIEFYIRKKYRVLYSACKSIPGF